VVWRGADASFAWGRREGLLEQQMVTYQEDIVKSAGEQRNVGTVVYSTECERENQAKTGELRFGGGTRRQYGGWKGINNMDKINFKIIINTIHQL
jgi:hypothetical protein